MKIIICGAGRVGQGIAERLSQDHDVTMIDENAALLDRVATKFEVRTTIGHAAHPETLDKAGASSADMIIAVTHSDEVNMVTCQVAHSLFKVTSKIARIRSQAYTKHAYADLFTRDNLPVDMHISPELEVSRAIQQSLSRPGTFFTATLASGAMTLFGLEVTHKSPMADARVDAVYTLSPEIHARIVGIGRDRKLFAPQEEEVLNVGDRVYWIVPTVHADHLLNVLEISGRVGGLVILVGAGHIGLDVAKNLEMNKSVRIRVIEARENTAERAAEELKRAIVFHGDGLNPEVLEEAGVSEANLVIGLTNDDKTNLLLGALAKKMGARKVISLVNEQDFAEIKSTMGIDVMIDPRSITVSKILLKLRQGRFASLHTLENGKAEVVEGVVKESAPIIGMDLTGGDLPEGMSLGAILRDGQPLRPNERVSINDTVILFAEKDMSRKVDLLFRVNPEHF